MNPIGIKVKKYGSRKRNSPATEIIERAETLIGFRLPEDYRHFINGYTGFESMIGKEFVQLWDAQELIESNSNYRITTDLNNTLGIGKNGGGEYIALEKLEQDQFRIVLSPLIDLDKEYHIPIGESFTDFFLRLESGKRWFE